MIIPVIHETYLEAFQYVSKCLQKYYSNGVNPQIPVIVEHNLSEKTLHIASIGGTPVVDILEIHRYKRL
jgi:hypothetical protein